MCSAYRKNPEDQTHEEWLADYNHVSGNTPAYEQSQPWRDRNTDNSIHLFHYVGHRTTRTGSVAMDFETLDHKMKGTCFFNVELISKYGKNYPAGKRGQFNPKPNSKFRKFWMQAVGKPPYRWSRVHKQMRSSLRGLVFVGKIKPEVDSKGSPYFKIIDIWPK
jgi:hypothetical protein